MSSSWLKYNNLPQAQQNFVQQIRLDSNPHPPTAMEPAMEPDELPQSIYRGVSWNSERWKWQASISWPRAAGTRKRAPKWLKCHDTEVAAARAYNNALDELVAKQAITPENAQGRRIIID
jgi:hypothetical protein